LTYTNVGKSVGASGIESRPSNQVSFPVG
jgi:hypothetical protein